MLMKASHTRGFTLVELVVTLMLIGIVSAIGVSRFFDRAPFDVAQFSDQTRAMLRYGQKLAVAQRRVVFVRVSSSNLALCFDNTCSAGMLVPAPGGGNSGSPSTKANCASNPTWYCEGVPANLSVTLAPAAAPYLFVFDAQGKPYSSSDNLLSASSSFVQLLVTISGSGSSSTVTVVPETGYVY